MLTLFLAALALGLSTKDVAADVSVDVSIWHGYVFYYPSLSLTVSDPAPLTYHRIESPTGRLWLNRGTNNDDSDFFLTNDLNVVIGECTGLWNLFLNKTDASEMVYYFAVSVSGVTTNIFGDVRVLFPVPGSVDVTNRPTVHFTGPINLGRVDVQAYHQVSGNSYYVSLPGAATNWITPGALTAGLNTVYVNYYSNNFPGITFTTPTNGLGATLPGWSALGGLYSYTLSTFDVA